MIKIIKYYMFNIWELKCVTRDNIYISEIALFCFQLYQEGLVQGSKDMSSREDLVRRACNAERSRDEATAKLDSMRSEMERLKNT